MAKQRIDAHVAELVGFHIAHLKRWSHGAECHLHIATSVVETMAATTAHFAVGEKPTHIGKHQHITHIDIAAIVQIFRDFCLAPCANVIHIFQCHQYRIHIFGFLHIDVGREVAFYRIHPLIFNVFLHWHGAVGIGPRHTMVASHNQIHLACFWEQTDALPHVREQFIEVFHFATTFLGHRSSHVACVVGLLKIAHNEVWAFAFWKLEQAHHLVGTLHIGEQRLFLIVLPIVGIAALDGNIATHPIHRGCGHTLTLGSEPNGVAAIVSCVGTRFCVTQRIFLASGTNAERIGDNTVVVRHQTRSKRIVVGECF